MIEETADKCPFCGATNNAVKRTADKTPKTIAELQQWYQDRHLPPYETTRFFIGINYKKPKAFGIYQDGDQFIVYKNKANGERAIRYQGTDEAYAVNELYLKLKSEILNQKANNQTRKQQQTLTREQKKEKRKNILITFAIFFAARWPKHRGRFPAIARPILRRCSQGPKTPRRRGSSWQRGTSAGRRRRNPPP